MFRIVLVFSLMLSACRPSQGGAVLSGVVQLVGESDSSGVEVVLSGVASATMVTDTQGSYTFSDVVEGSYTITATASSTREKRAYVVVTVDGSAVTVAPFVFTPVGSLHGRLLDSTGEFGPIVFVEDGSAAATVDTKGVFHLNGVSTGAHRVSVMQQGSLVATSDVVHVSYGRDSDVGDLVQTPERPVGENGFVRGLARRLGEVEHAGITVTLTNERHTLATMTSADGHYEIAQVPPGIYSLTFSSGEYWAAISTVLVLSGAEGLLLEEALFPLPDITLARGRRIPKTANAFASPSGARLLRVNGARSFELIDLETGARAVTETARDFDVWARPAFSPDERQLLLTEASRNLWSLSLDGGAAVRLSDAYWAMAGFAGDQAVYLEQDAPGFTNVSASSMRVGGATRLASHAVCPWVGSGLRNCPRVAPNGERLVFLQASGTASSVPVRGGPTVDLGGPTDRMPLLSREGSRALVFMQSPTQFGRFLLRSVPVAGGPAVDVAEAALDGQWSDDGNHVLVLDGDKSLKSVPALGGPAVGLATDVALFEASPDSQRVLYSQNASKNLAVVPIGGGPPRILTTGNVFQAHFTSDSARVWFIERVGSFGLLKVASVSDGQVTQLSTALAVESHPWATPLLSPDAKHVAFFEKRDTGYELKVARLTDGRSAEMMPLSSALTELSWTPDGRLVTFLTNLKNEFAQQNGAYVLVAP